MTLIHDYHGNPNATYYTSKFLPAGWLSQDPTWSVHTAEETYQGTINVTKATIVSDNTVFAQLAADLGWSKLDQTAHAMGITSPLDGNPAEVIGGLRIGVTPLEMADAYATLANGGSHVKATIINKVVFPDGSTRNFGDTPPKRVFTDGETTAATDVLKQVITSGTGTAANYGCPAAGKTGTANNLENAWFVGYTPRMSTAVWVGYPQGNIPMADGFGGTLAAPIWHDFMQSASSGYCGNFPPPTTPFTGTAVRWPLLGHRQLQHDSRPPAPARAPPPRPPPRPTRTPTQPCSPSRPRGRPPATATGTGTGMETATATAAATAAPGSRSTEPGGTPPRSPHSAGSFVTGPRADARPNQGFNAHMPKEEKVELEGEVVEALPNAMFRVKLDNMDRVVLGHVAGKMRRFRIRILPGDRVRVELSPYDLDRARIVYRHR